MINISCESPVVSLCFHLPGSHVFHILWKPCGRLMCLQRATKSSPATLVASQLLPSRQFGAKFQTETEHKQTVEILVRKTLKRKKECTVWTCQVVSSRFDNCISKHFSCWDRRLMDWHDLAQQVRHVCLGKRYRWLAKVVLLKFIMSVCLYSVMNYSQQAPLTSLKRAAKSVSVRL